MAACNTALRVACNVAKCARVVVADVVVVVAVVGGLTFGISILVTVLFDDGMTGGWTNRRSRSANSRPNGDSQRQSRQGGPAWVHGAVEDVVTLIAFDVQAGGPSEGETKERSWEVRRHEHERERERERERQGEEGERKQEDKHSNISE